MPYWQQWYFHCLKQSDSQGNIVGRESVWIAIGGKKKCCPFLFNVIATRWERKCLKGLFVRYCRVKVSNFALAIHSWMWHWLCDSAKLFPDWQIILFRCANHWALKAAALSTQICCFLFSQRWCHTSQCVRAEWQPWSYCICGSTSSSALWLGQCRCPLFKEEKCHTSHLKDIPGWQPSMRARRQRRTWRSGWKL